MADYPGAGLPVPAAQTAPVAAPAALEGEIMPAAPTFHDVTVVSTKKRAQVRVMGVPGEEFGIERGARTIRDANYCFHDVVNKTEGDLIAEGFDKEQVKELSTYTGLVNVETQSRDTVQEHIMGQGEANSAARLVRITEHYIRLDYEGTGRPCLYQVITGGDGGEVLQKDGKDCITPFDAMPFAAATPIPMTHRFFGRSIADITIPTQREKTALKRGALNNIYLRNNPRVEVAQDRASESTLDDLLVSRPGGAIRVKAPGGINWQVVPDVTSTALTGLQWLDAELEMKTGLSKQSQGIDANALQNQSATAANQVFSASQMRVKMIARVLAEGVRDMCSLIHATLRKHGREQQQVQIRKQWVTVNPSEWKARDHMTINVGLGTGGKAQQFAQVMALANVQKEMVQGGLTNVVGPTELYNTATELTKIMGHKNPNRFFKDPDAKGPDGQLLNPPPPPKPDPKTQAIQAQGAVNMATAQHKAQLDQEKAQLEAGLTKLKAEFEARLRLLEAHLEAATAHRTARHEEARHRLDIAHDIVGIAGTAHAHDVGMAQKQREHEQRLEAQEAAAAAAEQGNDAGS